MTLYSNLFTKEQNQNNKMEKLMKTVHIDEIRLLPKSTNIIILKYCQLHPGAIEEISKFSRLQILDLSFTRIDSRRISAKSLRCLRKLHYLQSLNLNGIFCGDEGVLYISKMQSLSELSIVDSFLTDSDATLLARLTDLQLLNLKGNRITNYALLRVVRLPKLKELKVSINPKNSTHYNLLIKKRIANLKYSE